MICNKCGNEIVIGGWPYCPHEHATQSVVADDIPGGMLVHHGICNEDGSPRRYYSRSEMAAEAKKRGLVNVVEHIPEQGSDKSRHTTRWVAIPPISEEERLENWWAKERLILGKQFVTPSS